MYKYAPKRYNSIILQIRVVLIRMNIRRIFWILKIVLLQMHNLIWYIYSIKMDKKRAKSYQKHEEVSGYKRQNKFAMMKK